MSKQTIPPGIRAIMAAQMVASGWGIKHADQLIQQLGYTVADQSVEVNEVDQFPEAGKKVETWRVRVNYAQTKSPFTDGEELDVIQHPNNPMYWKTADGRSLHCMYTEIIERLPDDRKTFTPLVITPDTVPTHKWIDKSVYFFIPAVLSADEIAVAVRWDDERAEWCAPTHGIYLRMFTPLTPPEIAAWKAENKKEQTND